MISGLIGDTRRKQQERSIRDFIWSHWRAHRPGHIAVTWISVEGEPNTYSFVVAPNLDGLWCVSAQVARTVLHRAGTGARYESNSWAACTLERKFANDGTPHSVDEAPQAEDYRLLLIDKDSKIRADI